MLERDRRHVAQPHDRIPLAVDHGAGNLVDDGERIPRSYLKELHGSVDNEKGA